MTGPPREIRDGSRIFEKLKENRAYILRQVLLPLAEDSDFLAAMADGNRDQITTALGKRANWIDADIAIASDAQGRILAISGAQITPGQEIRNLSGADYEGLSLNDKYFDLVSVPIGGLAENGSVSMGFALDDSLARRFAAVTGLEMTLMAMMQNGQFLMLGSSLPQEQRVLIMDTGNQIAVGMSPKRAAEAMSEEYLSVRIPYFENRQDISAVLQTPLHKAMAPFAAAVKGTLIQAAFTSIICALALAFFLSRGVTQPVHKLLVAARQMRIGDYIGKLDIRTSDEFGELAKAFDSMRRGIAEREQRIMEQARFDHLTGLPNRDYGIELLNREVDISTAENKPLAVFVMHMHRFREIQTSPRA